MADASKITVNGETYDVKDPTARDAASAAQTTANGKLSDAPSDGKQYARQDGAWVEVSGGGGSGTTQPWPITSLADDTIQKWATIPNGTYWYGNNGYFNSPENLEYGFLEHKVIGGDVTQTFYTQSWGPIFRRSGYNNDIGFTNWFKFRTEEINKWYLPSGISESHVIAAYQFVNRDNEAKALLNVNDGMEYPLSKILGTEIWSLGQGFYIPSTTNAGLNNATLASRYADILSAAFGYSGVSTEYHRAPGIMPNATRVLETAKAQFCVSNGTPYYTNSRNIYGVLATNWVTPPNMYFNGSAQSLTAGNWDHTGRNKIFGVRGNYETETSPCYITALVFYNVTLTASQHLQLSDNIRALGGIA